MIKYGGKSDDLDLKALELLRGRNENSERLLKSFSRKTIRYKGYRRIAREV